MVKRRIVSTGDKTTTGGTVIGSADSVNTDTGKAARLGDKVWCPACNQTGLIAQGYTGWMIDNKPVALDDYPVRCGCPVGTHRIIARNNSIFVDDNYSGIMYLPEQSLRANLSSNTLSHTYTHSTQQAPSSTLFQHSSTHKSIAATTRVFAKSCTVDKGCSDAAEEQEPSTNVGAMLIYSIVSAFSSPANAHHPSMLPYSGNNHDSNPYPVNGGTVGMAPVPVIIPTLPVPMMGFAPAPIVSYPSPNINIPTILDNPNAAFFVSSALLDSANSGKSFTSALMGVMIAELFGDEAQYDEQELRDLAEIRGYAKTRIRFFFEQDENGQLVAKGLHTVAGTRYENVRVRRMDWSRTDNHYEFTETKQNGPTIIWTPAWPEGSEIPTHTDYPAGEFNQPTIFINPIHELENGSNVEGLPLLDPKDLNDYILVFPADSGIPPIYVYFSKVFRGDDSYAGGPIGQPKEGEITGEDIWDHITAEGDGRLTSFSEKLKSSSNSRGANYFTKKGKIVKVELDDLESLSAQGAISIITKDEAKRMLLDHPKKKMKDSANSAYQIMDKNNEILVHGQVPAQYIKPVK